MLTFDQKAQCSAASVDHLYWFQLEGNTFKEQAVTCDRAWMHYCTPRVKVDEYRIVSHVISTSQKTQDKAVHWQDHGECVLGFRRSVSYHIDFLPCGITINVQYFSNLLLNYVHHTIWKTWETAKDHNAWQHSSIYSECDEGDIGNNRLVSHEPASFTALT
jgi:hypothetical protein